jgi:hypothetical protein
MGLPGWDAVALPWYTPNPGGSAVASLSHRRLGRAVAGDALTMRLSVKQHHSYFDGGRGSHPWIPHARLFGRSPGSVIEHLTRDASDSFRNCERPYELSPMMGLLHAAERFQMPPLRRRGSRSRQGGRRQLPGICPYCGTENPHQRTTMLTKIARRRRGGLVGMLVLAAWWKRFLNVRTRAIASRTRAIARKTPGRPLGMCLES